MDKGLRNLLYNTTQAIRRGLEEEFALQLEGVFDIHRDGRMAEQPGSQLTEVESLLRGRIVAVIDHRRASGESARGSIEGFLRETVFTFLNRLAALKMLEARGLVLPCVSAGDQSQGFKEFAGLAPGLIDLPDKGYRLYLECLFDEIGREVGVLFDRTDSASLLWPRRKALEAALEKLNTPALSAIWAEDETIGWIYQYYNDPTERKKMREESAAPRNSRELAVRNQFFTPRYVVEFLTDNTLGRIWYEMCQGRTRLKEQCRYLVRRPTEVFLAEGEEGGKENLTQEELRKQPVEIPYRALKDPRDLRLLDPACGSMHFGLYAFDLFEAIYAEAWDMQAEALEGGEYGRLSDDRPAPGIPDQRAGGGTPCPRLPDGTFDPGPAEQILKRLGWQYGEAVSAFRPLPSAFPSRDAFLKAVPAMIIEHNLHGIDIDPRAVQIAGLSLWLRAQRAWSQAGVRPAGRPRITRSNIVCAEPMPGEKVLLREFVEQQFPAAERPIFLHLLETIFDRMKLAGEAGSLLRIEEEIKSAIDTARTAWENLQARPRELFSTEELNLLSRAPELIGLDAALAAHHRALTTDFWQVAEQRIYDALEAYAEQAGNGGGFQRRLFAGDAAQGFAFIDLCRKHYDVVVMNPPFGEWSACFKAQSKAAYPDSYNDILAAFVDRGGQLLNPGGRIGAITSRTCFFLSSFSRWRDNVVLGFLRPELLVDLGHGVMDAAMVEAAAYVLAKPCSTRPDDSASPCCP